MIARTLLAFLLCAAAWAQNPPAAESPKPSTPAATTATTTATAATTAPADPLSSANALLKQGKLPEASAAYRAILEKTPESAPAHVGLIRSLLRSGMVDEAEEAGKKAAAAAPSSAAVQAAVGDVAFRAGKFADAEAGYRASLRLDANSARGRYGIGRMYDMVSMRKQAKNAFIRAHELDPDDRQIYTAWLDSLSYTEQLEAVKKTAGDHPSEREQQRISYLTAAVQKKPWVLASEIKPTEIKMLPYGRKEEFVDRGSQFGMIPISKGYGLQVKFNDRASAVLLLDTGAGGIVIGNKLAEKAGVVKIADSFFGGIGDKGPIKAYFGWVDKINIGSVEFHNCVVEVSSRNNVADEAGLIGTDVFDKFLVTLDFKEWKLLLAPLPKNPNASANDDEPQDRYVAPEMQSFTKIWRFEHNLVMPVVVSDTAMGNFILDTGADSNTMSPRMAEQVTKVSYQGGYVKGVSGSVRQVLQGNKAILQFARVRVRSDDIFVFDSSVSNYVGTEIAGFIGIKTLVQMKMSIDYRDGLVNLEVYNFKPARD